MLHTCKGCGRKFRMVLTVSDSLWSRIQPGRMNQADAPLCAMCVVNRIENLSGHAHWTIVAHV